MYYMKIKIDNKNNVKSHKIWCYQNPRVSTMYDLFNLFVLNDFLILNQIFITCVKIFEKN